MDPFDRVTQDLQAIAGELDQTARLYTATDRLANRMLEVATLPEQLEALGRELRAARAATAHMCIEQARQVLDAPGTALPARQDRARRFRALALQAAPELREVVDQNLPEFAPPPPRPRDANAKTKAK